MPLYEHRAGWSQPSYARIQMREDDIGAARISIRSALSCHERWRKHTAGAQRVPEDCLGQKSSCGTSQPARPICQVCKAHAGPMRHSMEILSSSQICPTQFPNATHLRQRATSRATYHLTRNNMKERRRRTMSTVGISEQVRKRMSACSATHRTLGTRKGKIPYSPSKNTSSQRRWRQRKAARGSYPRAAKFRVAARCTEQSTKWTGIPLDEGWASSRCSSVHSPL